MVTVNHEIDFEKAQEIALGYDIIAEQEEKGRCDRRTVKRGRGRSERSRSETAGCLRYGTR